MPEHIGYSGERCPRSGLYLAVSDCCQHQHEIALSEDEPFPPCRDCKEAVEWIMTIPTKRHDADSLEYWQQRYDAEIERREQEQKRKSLERQPIRTPYNRRYGS